MTHSMQRMLLISIAGLTSLLAGCRGQTTDSPPVVFIRNMHDQPRYDMQSQSHYFPDRRTMRPPVSGTVSRTAEIDTDLSEGLSNDRSSYVMTVPDSVTEYYQGAANLYMRGQQRFDIYCSPCHDLTGSGQGIVVKHGMLQPPSFHDERLRHAPDGQIFASITNGIRNMPPYRSQIPVYDRWAIVAYVRALQLAKMPSPQGEGSK